jgi:para-nitrobenzyl esterase
LLRTTIHAQTKPTMSTKLSKTKTLKWKGLLAATLMLFFTAADANAWQQQSSGKATDLLAEKKVEVKIIRDIRYASAPETFEADSTSDRKLDVYTPVNTTKEKLPVILFIHGGGFSGGDKKSTAAVCNSFSSLGYAVVSINYRLELKRKKVQGASAGANMAKGVPEKGFHPALSNAVSIASEDAQLALKWIKENASKYNFNTAKVVISGGSAGGMTALYTAYMSNQKVLPIKAVVNLWGGLEQTSPINKKSPALLTYHGDLDKIIHVDFAHALHKQMEKAGHPQAELRIMEGLGHAQYNVIAKEKAVEIDAFLKKVL